MRTDTEKATDILKIEYAVSGYDFDAERYCLFCRYTLFPDGRVTCTHYGKGIRRLKGKSVSERTTAEEYERLCLEINDCIDNAAGVNGYDNDRTGEVKIYRPFRSVDTMDEGYGTETADLKRLLERYIHNVCADCREGLAEDVFSGPKLCAHCVCP